MANPAIRLPRWQPRRWLILILAGALAARLGFVLLFGSTLSLQASGYDEYAVNLLDGRGYTRFDDGRAGDSDLPPLYGFFLAGVYAILGRSPIPVALIQTGFDLLTIALIYAIGRRTFPDRASPALLGAAFTAFYPYLLFQDLTANDTALFVLLLAAGVWGAYRVEASLAAGTRGLRWAAWIGLCFGLAALTKTLVVLLLPMLALWWWRQAGFRAAFLAGLVAALVLGIVILPWVIRNTALQGQLVLISTNDGSNLHQGNNPCAADFLAAGWDVQWIGGDCYPPMPDGLDEVEQSAWHRDQALAWLAAHPDAWPRLFGQKFLTLWNPQIMPFEVPPPEMGRRPSSTRRFTPTRRPPSNWRAASTCSISRRC
jgi:4-amino-4-deoxy-L-arabinose transferase-like glycosyltransferase